MKVDYSKNGIYGHMDYGVPGVCKGVQVVQHLLSGFYKFSIGVPFEQARFLTVGSGNGFEFVQLRKNGFNAHNFDLYIPPVPMIQENSTQGSMLDMPFKDKEFDVLISTEVMEHIPLEECDIVLKECRRVANVAIFSIATIPDHPFDTHVNVQTGLWWLNKFKEIGFNIIHGAIRPIMTMKVNGKLKIVPWADGVFIIAGC